LRPSPSATALPPVAKRFACSRPQHSADHGSLPERCATPVIRSPIGPNRGQSGRDKFLVHHHTGQQSGLRRPKKTHWWHAAGPAEAHLSYVI